MSVLRKRNSPGIEINEIDRSQYNKTQDYSFPNAPVCLITGFADKGENYKTQWINSKTNFIKSFGYPTNDAETYFFNAACEILNKNSILLAHKLPYNNKAKDTFTYTEYTFSKLKTIIPSEINIDILEKYETLGDLYTTLKNLLIELKIDFNENEIISLKSIYDWCEYLINTYNLNDIKSKKTVQDLVDTIKSIISQLKSLKSKYIQIFINDNSISSYIELECNTPNENLLKINEFDDLLTYKNTIKNKNKNNSGKITIVNKSGNIYKKIELDNNNNEVEYLGIVPVIITAANALYFQKLLQKIDNQKINQNDYNLISNITVRKINDNDFTLPSIENFVKPFNSDTDIFDETTYDNSISKQLCKYFPTILHTNYNRFDRTNFKKIGIVVLQLYKDNTENRINFEVLESFIGSIDKKARNEITKKSEFIDNIVNSQSQYINVFTQITDIDSIEQAMFLGINNQIATSLGFYKSEMEKIIDYNESIIDPLNKMFGVLNNPTTSNIDIIVDAGVSNIAQYLKGNNISFSNSDNKIEIDTINSIPKKWFNVVKKFDDFCKYTRKDCIFIADAPRPLCLEGNQKIVRTSKPENTIENSILPKMKYLTNINSSYSTGYCDWFYCQDEYTGDFFWCPPSIKAAGVFCYTDIYFHPWDAPAGNKRGIITNAYDVAFSPNNTEADRIYQNCWNYAINYPLNGIILEGQKTFQKEYTALDRVNVRRLLLYLEKKTASIAKMFLYEGNSVYIRQKLVDSLIPIFEDAKNGNGISEYIIKCDETNNTIETINRNELHVTIAVRPIKTIEYIVINFITTNQTTNISEEVKRI